MPPLITFSATMRCESRVADDGFSPGWVRSCDPALRLLGTGLTGANAFSYGGKKGERYIRMVRGRAAAIQLRALTVVN